MSNRPRCLFLGIVTILFFVMSNLVFGDDHGDDFATATLVDVGGITSGVLDAAGDRDYFRFTASQAGVYVIYTKGARDTTGTLYDSSYKQVANDIFSKGELENFRIVYEVSVPGTYHVEVVGSNNAQIAPYTLHVDGQRYVIKTEGLSSPLVRSRGVSMRVLWTITKYKIGGGALWGEEEARKMLFKPLDMDATKITFDGQTCREVIFQKEMVEAKEYLANAYRTTAQALGIQEKRIEVVKTNCDLPGFAEYIRLTDRRLIIHLNGVFFYFEPAVNY